MCFFTLQWTLPRLHMGRMVMSKSHILSWLLVCGYTVFYYWDTFELWYDARMWVYMSTCKLLLENSICKRWWGSRVRIPRSAATVRMRRKRMCQSQNAAALVEAGCHESWQGLRSSGAHVLSSYGRGFSPSFPMHGSHIVRCGFFNASHNGRLLNRG